MQHRALPTGRPNPIRARTAGPVRIKGAYPPPPTPCRTGRLSSDASDWHITRYDRGRRGSSAVSRPWAGVSVLLAAAGVVAVTVLPQQGDRPARLDTPVAVVGASGPTAQPSSQLTLDLELGVPPSDDPPAPVGALPTAGPTKVQIPVLGVTSPIMELDLKSDGAMEVPPGAYPVGWFTGGSRPGDLGPAIFAGHVDWAGERGAFYGLHELRAGDEVVVDRADGTQAVFVVRRVERYAKDDFPTDEVYGDLDHPGLRLITCGGVYNPSTGDYADNVVVFGDLASIR